MTEYLFSVPLDHARPDEPGQIHLFARCATKYEPTAFPPRDNANSVSSPQRPYMVYLQGGPGFGCPEPQDFTLTRFLLSKGYQALYLDYRGVGLSTPVTPDTIPQDPSDQLEYLKCFRQDTNVHDLEAVRKCLTANTPRKQWSIFGQSFGGFVSLSYLSQYPDSLSEVYMTGGLAPISTPPQHVYAATFQRVMQRNAAYYKKYPEDVQNVRRIVHYLRRHPTGVKLPNGGTLSARRLLTLGHSFGMHGGLDTVHTIIMRMTLDLQQWKFLTRPTLAQFEGANLPLDENPIYAILHEAIYCYKRGIKSDWAAQRVGQTISEFQWLCPDDHAFDNAHKTHPFDDPQIITDPTPLFFTGEMIFPFMFEDYPELKKLHKTAHALATSDARDDLYDEAQLARNTVPVYAASFIDDMYVDWHLANETAKKVNNTKIFSTNMSKSFPP